MHAGDPHQPTPSHNRAFALGVLLNTVFVAVEFVYGSVAGSLALVADAGHNLSDVLGLLIAWGATLIAKHRPSAAYTYGLRKATVLAAMSSAVLLLVAMGALSWDAIARIGNPPGVDATAMLIVASIGVAVNAGSAALFVGGRRHDLNLEGAFLHLAADALVSLGVVLAGIVILGTGWYWVDPAISLVIGVVVVAGTLGLLRDSARLALDAAPRGLDLRGIAEWLGSQAGVVSVHDLHVWAISTTEQALTAHLVVAEPMADPVVLAAGLESRFGIGHSTIQIERAGSACAASCDVGGADARTRPSSPPPAP